jgi:hypothetical protein
MTMLARSPKKRKRRKKLTAEQRNSAARLTRECRERARKGLGRYRVNADEAMLNLLVERHYLRYEELTDEALVSKALSQALWDLSRS